MSDRGSFEAYRRDGEFFAAILAEPDCPASFRDLFAAAFTDELLCRAGRVLGFTTLLPITYPIVLDVLDVDGYCGTAKGIHDTLIQAVEVLVPSETAKRVRDKLGLVKSTAGRLSAVKFGHTLYRALRVGIP
jgi:hypothetical protein